jgi:hypothetical protein
MPPFNAPSWKQLTKGHARDAKFGRPASETQLAAAEQGLGIRLPWNWCNGSRATGQAPVVLKHYFRPGREDFRTVITQAMPKMLGLGDSKAHAKEEMKRILERSTNRTWSADRKRLLELIEAL